MNKIKLFNHATLVEQFSAGAAIFTQGEAGELMYVITEGQVDIYVDDVLVATREPGETVGEMAFIDGRPRSATARARTDCTLAPVSRRNFQFLLDNSPHFAAQVMRLLVERLRELQDDPSARPPAEQPVEPPPLGQRSAWQTNADGGISAQWVTVPFHS